MRLAYEAPRSHIWWAPRRVIHMEEVCSIHWSHKIVFPSVHTNMREREGFTCSQYRNHVYNRFYAV